MNVKAYVSERGQSPTDIGVRCPVCGRLLLKISLVLAPVEMERRCHKCKNTIGIKIYP